MLTISPSQWLLHCWAHLIHCLISWSHSQFFSRMTLTCSVPWDFTIWPIVHVFVCLCTWGKLGSTTPLKCSVQCWNLEMEVTFLPWTWHATPCLWALKSAQVPLRPLHTAFGLLCFDIGHHVLPKFPKASLPNFFHVSDYVTVALIPETQLTWISDSYVHHLELCSHCSLPLGGPRHWRACPKLDFSSL